MNVRRTEVSVSAACQVCSTVSEELPSRRKSNEFLHLISGSRTPCTSEAAGRWPRPTVAVRMRPRVQEVCALNNLAATLPGDIRQEESGLCGENFCSQRLQEISYRFSFGA